jgi:hypothetical protein
MFLICIPNIIHDYINVVSDDINMIIDKVKAKFINNYYFYIVESNLTTAVSFSVNSYNGGKYLISSYTNDINYNTILMHTNTYDNGVAKIFHQDYNYIIALVQNKVIELEYVNRTLSALQ